MPTPAEPWRRPPLVAMHDEGPPRDPAPTQTTEPSSEVRPSPLPAPSVPPSANLLPLSKRKARRVEERLADLESDMATVKVVANEARADAKLALSDAKRARDSAVDLRAELMTELGNVRSSNDGVKSALDVAVLGISNLSSEVNRLRAPVERGATASVAVQTATTSAPAKVYRALALILAAILIQILVVYLKR